MYTPLLVGLVLLAGLVGLVLLGASLLTIRVDPAKVAVCCIAAVVVALLVSMGFLPTLAQWVSGFNPLVQIIVLLAAAIGIPIAAMATCLSVVDTLPQRQAYALSMFATGGVVAACSVVMLAITSDASTVINEIPFWRGVGQVGQIGNTIDSVKLALWACLVIGVCLIAGAIWLGRTFAPAAPTGLTTTSGPGSISLKWQPVKDAVTYRVSRGQSGGNYVVVAEIPNTDYHDRDLVPGTTYFYAVAAANGNGISRNSAEISAIAQQLPAPPVASPNVEPPTSFENPPQPLAGWLVLTSGRERGKTININRSVMRLGRKRDCDITIEDDQVSGLHAQLRVEGTLCRLNDLDSRNGTWLNGERVQGARTLDDGDEIVVGQTKLVYKRVF
jgi:hypothetical protein